MFCCSRTSVVLSALLILSAASPLAAQLNFDIEPISTVWSWDLDLADLDGDGDLDTVVSETDTAAGLTVYLNDGDASFGAVTTYDIGDAGWSTDIGDVDGDGDLDLVVLTRTLVKSIVVLLNDGSGQFAVGTVSPVSLHCEDISLGDLDGDGDLDALLAVWTMAALMVFDGDGQGAFTEQLTLPVFGGRSFGVEAVDLDGDGDLDAALTAFGSSFPNSGRLHIFPNLGDGAFGEPTSYSVKKGTSAIEAGDMDGDGDIDLLTSNRNSFSVSLFLNQSTGVFGLQQITTVGAFPADARLGDFDGDGDLDVVVPSSSSNDLHVLENDGAGGLSTALILLGAHDFHVAAAGDLDGDGLVDFVAGGSGRGAGPGGFEFYRNASLNTMPWANLGNALTGSAGAPVLSGSGSLTGASVAEVALTTGNPLAPATLVAGFSQLGAPLKGGVLVPSPDAFFTLNLDANGSLVLAGVWPSGIPSGVELFLQCWIVDSAGPAGFSASNGIVGTTP